MPKVSKLQPSFNTGEVSPLLYGRVDAERYKSGLSTCLNYLPTIQGPLVRRPGTKYVTSVKDPSKPPVLIPFQYSATQAYILEFGDQYVRFYANGGQVLANTSIIKVSGVDFATGDFVVYGLRTTGVPNPGETIVSSSVITANSLIELQSPYSQIDVAHLKWAQNSNTMYITHPSYPVYKLQFGGAYAWDFYQVKFRDGPYLPLNSYSTIGDQVNTDIVPTTTGPTVFISTGPIYNVTHCESASSQILVHTLQQHGYQTGQKVFVYSVAGTVEANNGNGNINSSAWSVAVVTNTSFILISSTFSNNYISGGFVAPAMFAPNPLVGPSAWVDVGRNVRLYAESGSNAWGVISGVTNVAQAVITMNTPPPNWPSSSAIQIWQLGSWYSSVLPSNNFPSCCTFHQDRLIFAGAPNGPQDINGSVVGDYENFAPNNIDTMAVADSNSFQFTLNSAESNKIQWMKSTSQGLLAGSYSSEWSIAPSSQQDALTPTNFNASQTGFFGSTDVDAIQLGNATIHVSRAARKLREMSFFFQLGTYRSTDLTELSEHLGIPGIVKLAVQQESQPTTWAINSSGGLISMSYNRDDLTLKVGWARHQLGGQVDSGGTPPTVNSIAVIPAPDQTYDQLWMVVNRQLNGSSAVTVEYMTNVYNDKILQEDAFQLDCGSTYDNPFALSGITTASSQVVVGTILPHGFSNGDLVKISNVQGLTVQSTDVNGNVSTSSLVNGQTFLVGSSASNTFNLLNTFGNPDSFNTASYVNLTGQVRKFITTVSGLTQLKNETVGVLADGAVHPDIVVASSGVATLQYSAAKVQFGYRYNSDAATLTSTEGSAQGSAIGSMRRIARAGIMVHQIGDLSIGTDFNRLIPVEFQQADVQLADQATPLFSGMHRDGVEAPWTLTDVFCFRQSSPLPGMIQALTLFLEENDI